MKEIPSISNPSNGITKPLEGELEFKHVGYTYPDTGIQALKDVSFTVRPGEKVALLGRTGTGKTTLADLVLRLMDTSSGTISIDGADVKAYDLPHLRGAIGYVPQDVFLFSDTIFQNIAFGNDALTREQAKEYAKYASIHTEIEGLPQGYDTVTGERGVTLSGGQKQRISIARCFAKQPRMLILDDCLSAVDTHTEASILQYLSTTLADRTTLIITHRIYHNFKFDRILVLDAGSIVEQGTHDELMQLGGYYSELYARQQIEEQSATIEPL